MDRTETAALTPLLVLETYEALRNNMAIYERLAAEENDLGAARTIPADVMAPRLTLVRRIVAEVEWNLDLIDEATAAGKLPALLQWMAANEVQAAGIRVLRDALRTQTGLLLEYRERIASWGMSLPVLTPD